MGKSGLLTFGLSALFGALLITGALYAGNGWSELQSFKFEKADLYADLIHAEGFHPSGQEELKEVSKIWEAAMERTLWPIWSKIDHGFSLLTGTISTFLYGGIFRLVRRRGGIPVPSRLGLGILTAAAALLSVVLIAADDILSVSWREIVPWWSDSLGIVIFGAVFMAPLLAVVFASVSLALSFLGSRPEFFGAMSNFRASLWLQIAAVMAAAPFWMIAALSAFGSIFPLAATTPLWAHIGLTIWAYVRNGRTLRQSQVLPVELDSTRLEARETNLHLES